MEQLDPIEYIEQLDAFDDEYFMQTEQFHLEQLCREIAIKADLVGLHNVNSVLTHMGYKLVKEGK